jgi:hypothetical protein
MSYAPGQRGRGTSTPSAKGGKADVLRARAGRQRNKQRTSTPSAKGGRGRRVTRPDGAAEEETSNQINNKHTIGELSAERPRKGIALNVISEAMACPASAA